MVQELHVLRCFSCETFQSHIVKKSNKWECKICGEKQSIKKVYGRGSGKDCRIHTQKLNALKGQIEETKCPNQTTKVNNPKLPLREAPPSEHSPSTSPAEIGASKISKWAEFVDKNETSHVCPLTKREDVDLKQSKVSKSNINKRKTWNEHNNEEFRMCSDEFYSVGNSYSIVNEISSSGHQKKRKFDRQYAQKSNLSRNDSLYIDNSNHQGPLEKSLDKRPFKIDFKNHSRILPNAGEEEYHEECLKARTSNFSSQNNSNIQKKDFKISLKWAKYLEDDDDMLSSVNTNIEVESENCTIFKKPKYPLDESQINKDGNYLETLSPHLAKGGYLDNSVSVPSTCVEEVSSVNLEKSSFCNFSSSETEKREARISSTTNKSINSSFIVPKDNHCSNMSAKNSFIFHKSAKHITDNLTRDSLKNESHQERHNYIAFENGHEERSKLTTSSSLPVFEQNIELSESDFQLDF